MPQHLWRAFSTQHVRIRVCEVCDAREITVEGDPWQTVSTICPGDDDDDGARGRRRKPPPRPSPKLEELLA